MKKTTPFVETLRGKIVLAFALVIVAWAVMWTLNKVAFEKIAAIVHDLSTPNEKLAISRKLSLHVSNLTSLQQAEVKKGGGKVSNAYVNKTKEIAKEISSLRPFLLTEPPQLARIDSISSLLQSDNKLFQDYLQLSFDIEKKRTFERELKVLSYKIDSEKIKIDSNVVTNERKVTTTTVIPADTIIAQQKKKSWLKRLFGKPTEETVIVQKEPQVQIEEELKTTVDTLAVAKIDTSPKLGKSLRQIEKVRTQRLGKLEDTEEELLKANSVLIQQIQNILSEVEKQELMQVKNKTDYTVLLAGKTISQTRFVTIALVVIILLFAVVMIKEIGKSRKYRQEIEEAKAEAEYHSIAKQRFLANMSHEIRTPLQSIIGYSEQQLQEDNNNDGNIKAIHQSSKHLLQIVNEVLDYSRIISGKFTFNNEAFSVQNLIAEVAAGVRPLADKKSLEFIIDTSQIAALGNMVGDPFRLKQVLFNLLGNAIKFTEKGNIKLAVTSAQKQDQTLLSFVIEDTGIGMSNDELQHIFQQFEQAANSKYRQGGTGLGLTIVKELVEAQQGSVNVQSVPGKGSRFEVIIPFHKAGDLVAENVVVDNKNAFTENSTVWIVDDDQLILRLGSIILDKHDIPHVCFNSAEKLLEEPWDERVKFVLADMRLPGMSGSELCAMLRKKVPVHTKIIAMTAQVLPEEKESLLTSGFDALLLKPFVEGDLLAVLNKNEEIEAGVKRLDLSSLAQMLDDRQQLNAILKQCYDDTSDDVVELSKAVEIGDTDKTTLIIHRLAGRTGQVGEKNLAKRLRQFETAIRQQASLSGLKKEMKEILSQITVFLQLLQREMEATSAEVQQ